MNGRNGREISLPPRSSMRPVAPEIIHWPYQEERPSVSGSGHIHWTIQAFSRLQDDGTMSDVVTVTVEAASEIEAIARAQDVIVRALYRVASVTEVCSKDEALKNG